MVVVVGTTGAGKTKLSVDLARAIGGEVINADSLQMYKGLSVATAKVTAAEAGEVPHSLVSFLEPWEEYTVTDFRSDAMRHVARALRRGRLPIVAGGTGYYVQSLLRPSLLDDLGPDAAPASSEPAAAVEPEPGDSSLLSAAGAVSAAGLGRTPDVPSPGAATSSAASGGKRPRNGLPELANPEDDETEASAALFERLCALDLAAARKLHPGNRRRVLAAVRLAESTGTAASELAARQQRRAEERLAAAAAGSSDKPLASVIWVDADRAALDSRLDRRVGSMLRAGLLAEVEAVRARVRAAGRDPDTGQPLHAAGPAGEGAIGALIAIGCKELVPYFRHLEGRGRVCADHPLARAAQAHGDAALAAEPPSKRRGAPAAAASSGEAGWEEADELLRAGVSELQQHTRQYAREQLRWIRRRFRDRGVRLCRVDSTDPAAWESAVLEPALAEVASLRAAASAAARLRAGGSVGGATARADEALVGRHVVPPDTLTAEVDAGWAKYRCRLCDALCNGTVEWERHLSGHGHRARLVALRKQAKNLLDMAASVRRREGAGAAAAVAARIAAVPSFRAIGSEGRASLLLELGKGRPASAVVDLPWPSEDGVPAGEVPDAALPAFGRLMLRAGIGGSRAGAAAAAEDDASRD